MMMTAQKRLIYELGPASIEHRDNSRNHHAGKCQDTRDEVEIVAGVHAAVAAAAAAALGTALALDGSGSHVGDVVNWGDIWSGIESTVKRVRLC
jgi:hypothetical protein